MVPPFGRVAAQGLPAFPRLEVSPPCGPVAPIRRVALPTQLLISGRNFIPGQILQIEFDPSGFPEPPPPVATVTVGPYGSFDQPVSIVLPSVFGSFTIFATDTANSDFVIRTTFDTPCRTQITLKPNCGPAVDSPTDQVYDITVEGKSWGLGIAVNLTFELNGESIGKGTRVVPDDQGDFSTGFPQQAVPTGQYTVKASQPAIEGPGIEVLAEFRTPCPEPTLVVERPCGPAGSPPDRYELAVSGTGFIPNRGIYFFFDSGPNTQIFAFNQDTATTGEVGPLPIDPFRRPQGTYDVMARQYDGDRVAVEVHASFQVPCIEPKLTIDPNCGAPQLLGDEARVYDITVRGTGWTPGEVTIVFDVDLTDPLSPAVSFTAPVEKDGSFVRAIDPPRRPAGTYRIAALQKTRLGDVTSSVDFRAPCTPPKPTLQRDPVCGRDAPGEPGAYSIQLRLTGYIPGFVELIFDADGTPEPQTAFVGDNGRLTATITASGRAAGRYRVQARQQDGRKVLADKSVTFTVPCPTTRTPALEIQPTSGAPGFVAFVDGTDFPPGTVITLRWDRGIGARLGITVQADATGAFHEQVLIFSHDFAGVRQMTAGSETDPTAFPTASARFLVVAGQGSPPVLSLVDPFATGPGPPIVFRR